MSFLLSWYKIVALFFFFNSDDCELDYYVQSLYSQQTHVLSFYPCPDLHNLHNNPREKNCLTFPEFYS